MRVGGCVHSDTGWRGTTEVFLGVTRVIHWLFLSQAFQVRSLQGVQEVPREQQEAHPCRNKDYDHVSHML